jgi:hypothetical protein
MRRAVMVSAALMFVAPALASANVRGGAGGVVGPDKVGPLRLNHSTRNAVLAYAGKPTSHFYLDKVGSTTANLRRAVWEELGYGSSTQYWVWRAHAGSPWLFNGFYTTSRRWHTAAGTRVGMTSAQARRRERVPFMGGCLASGYWHSTHSWSYVVSIVSGRVNELVALGAHGPIC